MKELSKIELNGLITFNKRKIALYFYSPLCGTCQLATKMLEMTLAALPEVIVYRCNVNLMKEFIREWKISSVPCIVIMDGKQVIQKEYALESVSKLYTMLAPLKDSQQK